MKRIAHISDLHFGTEDPAIAEALLDELDDATVIAISGDLTQRATARQFTAARSFLDALRAPYVVVPGNHDVPLYDLVTRFFDPLRRYRRHITDDLMPLHADDELAVIGIDTAHGFTLKGGRITEAQARAIAARVAPLDVPIKAVVAHHPFVVPDGVSGSLVVDGAARALPILEEAGVDLIFAGHLHVAHIADAAGFRSPDEAIVSVLSGTSISTRLRGEPNGYNRALVDRDELTLVHRQWDGGAFVDVAAKRYRRERGRWRKLAEQVSPAAASPAYRPHGSVAPHRP